MNARGKGFTLALEEAQHPRLWQGEDMARNERNVVNLDALIPRADLFGDHPPVILDDRTIRISDLEP